MDNMADNIDLLSLNCRGLRNKTKRRTLFSWLEKYNRAIIMLQETHSDASIEQIWSNEYKGKIYFSHGSSNSRGVALLLPRANQNFTLNIKDVKSDDDGRILLVDTEVENNPLVFLNVYAPTKDNVDFQNNFLENLVTIVGNYSDKPMIIGGDFNTYLDSKLDKKGGISEPNSSYTSNLINFIEEYALVDIWRKRNKNKPQFTWRGKSRMGLIQSRLDYFFVSMSLESEVINAAISPSIGSDHSLVSLSFSIKNTSRRGNSFWKFNNILLKDPDYIKMVKAIIQDAILENPFNNNSLLWEYIKCRVRTETMTYSSRRAKEKN